MWSLHIYLFFNFVTETIDLVRVLRQILIRHSLAPHDHAHKSLTGSNKAHKYVGCRSKFGSGLNLLLADPASFLNLLAGQKIKAISGIWSNSLKSCPLLNNTGKLVNNRIIAVNNENLFNR